MRNHRTCMVGVLFVGLTVGVMGSPVQADGKADSNWPSFRGARAAGVADRFTTPSHWSAASGLNVKWKKPIEGLGHSSPVVWGPRIFLTSAVRDRGEAQLKAGLYGDIEPVADDSQVKWKLLCLDRATGDLLWQRRVRAGVPQIKRHPKSSHANSTPATDGSRVVVFFGSEGMVCFDVAGELLWEKDLGLLDSGYFRVRSAQWGFGSSPVIHGNSVFVQCDVQDQSFIAAYDLEDGRQVWRTLRDEVPTWSTPTVDVRPGRAQVIANGYKHIGGYDLHTGAELWRMRGGGDIPVPTPIVAGDLVIITNAHGRMRPVYAIKAGAEGDITLESVGSAGRHIAWSRSKGGNYMQTPIVVGDLLYLCTDGGVLTCYDVASGRQVKKFRLPPQSGFTASPVAADGKIYFTAETGEVVVLRAGDECEVLAVNDLGEASLATPAISQGTLFFRTRHHLVAIAQDQVP
jgi:outer membrane protein assembly factor BamB